MWPFTSGTDDDTLAQYLDEQLGDADVLLLVEWADGTISEQPATYGVKDNVLQAENGLEWKLVGQGAEPKLFHGVPVIRCHALIDRPVDTTVAIGAEMDEEDRFVPVTDERGATEVVEHVRPIDPGDAADGAIDPAAATAEPVAPDEGLAQLETDGAGQTVDRIYDLKPPDGCVGWAFSLTSAGQRAPNAVSPMDMHDAKERGKMSERDNQELLKYVAIGAGGTLALMIVIAVIFVVGQRLLSGGGGGGGASLGLLVALAGPSWRALRGGGADGADRA
jgi:hypothetical protein